MNATPIFVYGTLRPGDYNHGRFPGGVIKVISGCTANGRLYHAIPGYGRVYPGARFDEDGTITGDILLYQNPSDALNSVVSMEIGAGYTLEEIKVTLPSGKVIECIGFQYDRPHGALIESGDWFAEDAYEVERDLASFADDEYGEDWDDDWNDEED